MGSRGWQVLLTMFLAVAVAISIPQLSRAEGELLELPIDSGDIVISEDGYKLDGGELVSHVGPYRIVGTDQGTSKNTITIEGGVIDLTIEDLTVEAEDAPALYVKAGATLNLKVTGGAR